MTTIVIPDYRRQAEIADLVDRRKAMGVDHLDEFWEGVHHMSPPPHGLHGECAAWAGQVLRIQAQRHECGRVTFEAGVREPGSGRSNFRVPDISLIPLGYEYVDGWIEDGALLAVEVRSPREEVVQKLAVKVRAAMSTATAAARRPGRAAGGIRGWPVAGGIRGWMFGWSGSEPVVSR